MITKERYVKSPSGGTVSWNTDILRGVLSSLNINPSSATTTYDVALLDYDGTTIYEKKGNMGNFADNSKVALYGIYTVSITSISVSTNNFITTLLWDDEV